MSKNFTSNEWEKLEVIGGHTCTIYKRREHFKNHGSGRCDGRGDGRGDRGCGGGGRAAIKHGADDSRSVAAASTTEIVEYNAGTASANARESTNADRGGRNGGRFGPDVPIDLQPRRRVSIPRRWGGRINQQRGAD